MPQLRSKSQRVWCMGIVLKNFLDIGVGKTTK
jgi:hypothetical protein